MRRIALALLLAAAPAAAQPVIDAPLEGETDLGVLAPRCAGMMFLIAGGDPNPDIPLFTVGLVGATVQAREEAGLPVEEEDVKAAVFAYTDAYRALIDAEAYDILEADRAFCLSLGLAVSNASE